MLMEWDGSPSGLCHATASPIDVVLVKRRLSISALQWSAAVIY